MSFRFTLASLLVVLTTWVTGCISPVGHNLPPASRLLEPGPGVGGPGPGVLAPTAPPPGAVIGDGGVQFGGGGYCPPGLAGGGYGVGGGAVGAPTAQVLFANPDSLHVQWDVGGVGQFDSEPLVVPGRQNFPQGGIFWMKLTNIPGREGVELYPTIEIAATTPRTEAYLAHNAIPVQFTEEDFEQVLAGNFVTKVIYLPDPEFQVMALPGVNTLVSTRLNPGEDPVEEADRRGAIMAVVRLGNKDIELPGPGGVTEYGAGAIMHGHHAGHHHPAAGVLPAGYAFPGHVAGVTAPVYGMPISGTPIGLPGPPHIPLGGPATLQRHVMKNHTYSHIPKPDSQFKIHVKQVPGYHYPTPVSRMHVKEQSFRPDIWYRPPAQTKHELVH